MYKNSNRLEQVAVLTHNVELRKLTDRESESQQYDIAYVCCLTKMTNAQNYNIIIIVYK